MFDRDPFFPILDIETKDLLERSIILSFYVVLGDDHPLVGRDILRSRKMDSPGHSLTLPCPDDDYYVLHTYDDHPTIL